MAAVAVTPARVVRVGLVVPVAPGVLVALMVVWPGAAVLVGVVVTVVPVGWPVMVPLVRSGRAGPARRVMG
jgi:hypothetical protein